MISQNLCQVHLLEVGLMKIPRDHSTLFKVRHVGLHVDFTSIDIFFEPLGLYYLRVWSVVGLSLPFRPMRALRLQWSRAFSLVCEVALRFEKGWKIGAALPCGVRIWEIWKYNKRNTVYPNWYLHYVSQSERNECLVWRLPRGFFVFSKSFVALLKINVKRFERGGELTLFYFILDICLWYLHSFCSSTFLFSL